MSPKTPPFDENEDLPDALLDALQLAAGEEIEIPSEVDAALKCRIQAHFAKLRRRRLRWVRIASVAATAAAVLVLALSWSGDPQRRPGPEALVGDLDGSGRVDILDAFSLARGIRDGEKLSASGDLSGDGIVDEADVDALARLAVSLKGGGR